MINIKFENSQCKIEGLTTEQFRAFRKFLSYEVNPKTAYFSGGFVRPKSVVDAKGFFPSGLINKAKGYLTQSRLEFGVQDVRIPPAIKPNAYKLKMVPHKFQLEAAEKAIKSARGGVVAVTGSGKSFIIALIASKLGVSTLVVVPSVGIREQLIEAFKAYGCDMSKIDVWNIDSKALKTKKHYDCLIIDECHHVAAKSYQYLNNKYWNGIYYRFFLTATWGRNESNEQLLFESIAGEVVYQLPYKTAVDHGYIVPVEAYYFDVPKSEYGGYNWSAVYNELVVKNPIRNQLVTELMLRLKVDTIPTLCLVKEIEHGNLLSKLSGVPFANGQDEDSRRHIEDFNKGLITSLIGTVGILGEGVDTKPAEYVIVAGLGKAKSSFMQQVGRGVRKHKNKESCKVILFRDPSHKWTVNHFNAQKKILLEEYGVKVLKLIV
jgi:superfamily II DNA or RNA helicase